MSLYFTKEHEWVRVDGDVATVGISDHAQEALGDIVFAEVPDAGKLVAKGDDAAVVESVKAASRRMSKAADSSTEWRSIKIPFARSVTARRPNAPSRSWNSAKRRSTMSIELCQSNASASVM